MDSRIREAEDIIRKALLYARDNYILFGRKEHERYWDSAITALALLTAEPEPSNCPLYAATCSGHYDECPHADELRKEPSEDYEAWLRTQADGPWNTSKDDSGNYTDYSTALVFRGFVAAQHFASKVADKREEELRAQVETLRDYLVRITNKKLTLMHDQDGKEVLACWPKDNPVTIAHEALAATEPKP